ncbi:otoferlin-like isoform X2 [Orbicella faveolata]|uniref:otoferlin-like isoform X2 n=1 Tax=Orbicella faveolata TaxID=48498 RepID=UPI0009E4763C|nr:otoferlin-like isoform X2 [Orbicella faveolata]
MSLLLLLKTCSNLRGRSDRIARVTFRGVTYQTSVIENCSEADWDEDFEWPLESPLDPSEFIEIEVYNFNKIFNNRLVGVFRMVLQKLIQDGHLEVRESLIDMNNTVLKATVDLELQYNPPEGNVSQWVNNINDTLDAPPQVGYMPDNQYQMDPYSHQYSVNRDTERRGSFMGSTFGSKASKSQSMTSLTSSSHRQPRKESMPASIGGGGRFISPGDSPFDAMLKGSEGLGSRRGSQISMHSDRSMSMKCSHAHPRVRAEKKMSVREQDYQIQIRILEGRQLAGTQIDPVCTVNVGNQKKSTTIKEQTNCPFWDEFFVFDFKMPPMVLFDKIINFQVFTGRNLVSQGNLIGAFKLDVGTVYAQPDHRFCRRWAVMTDPEETLGASGAGIKGYLKVDITVLGKGDPAKEPPGIKDSDDDIEGNLLLPEGVPAERPKAKIIVKIYRAEGLPKMNSGLMANVKKAFTGEVRDLVDPYVEVCFAGHKARTTVKKNTYEPKWNEQIVFSELFPPLCRRMKVQLKDSDSVSDEVIGTHFIDLSRISNDGANGWLSEVYIPGSGIKVPGSIQAPVHKYPADIGFMPTFGPCWVNLYGSTRDYSLFDEHNDLNNGLGEGVAYRGRLLMAVQAEFGESASEAGIRQVEVEPTAPISDTAAGKEDQFQLFACFYEASMIERKVGDKMIQFEMSIGNYGNTIDGQALPGEVVDEVRKNGENPFIHPLTPPVRPVTNDRQYYHIPWEDSKPCTHIKLTWQDHRRRLYNSNVLLKICERLEDGLTDCLERVKMDLPNTYRWLSRVLAELINGCNQYLNLVKSMPTASHVGRTKLDKERLKLCQYEVESVCQSAQELKGSTKDDGHIKDNLKAANALLQRLLNIAIEPQETIPDVFIWMLCGGKRVAYTRLPSQHVIYSLVEEERGKDAGRMQTVFLRLPGKRGDGPKGWAIQAKLNVMIWLGLHKHKKDYLKDAPKGYQTPKNAHKLMAPPPNHLIYTEKQKFILRAHTYQARSLIGSDASGLSDAFGRVIFTHLVADTRVIWETRSPTWDQMLVFKDLILWGDVNEIAVNPPTIVIEVFDKDIGGDSEFIGRALARPIVKMACEPYEKPFFPPALEWFQIFRGEEKAGELLAAFELLQLSEGTCFLPTENEPVNTPDGPITPVPDGIRPVMRKHRIEVLFWGVREMKRINLTTVDRPQVDIDLAGHVIQSTVITNAKKNPNFQNPVIFFDVELPENERYCPPLTIRVRDCRTFGRFTLVGTHVLNSLHRYLQTGEKEKEKLEKAEAVAGGAVGAASRPTSPVPNTPADVAIEIDEDPPDAADSEPLEKKKKGEGSGGEGKGEKGKGKEEEDGEDALDWWSRYYETLKDKERNERKEEQQQLARASKKKEKRTEEETEEEKMKKKIPRLTIFDSELEFLLEYNGFNDWLHSFPLYRGKKTSEDDDDDHRIVGKFKGSLKVWKYPLPEHVEMDPIVGTFLKLPSNEPVNVLARVYVIKAINLHPSDVNGKADPYLVVTLGKHKVRDRDNYVSKQLNPVFGRCFEFEAIIPMDSVLTVGVYDWDLVGSDDLIGETKVDLENRFYSKHRPTCGLQESYATFGFNKWRDPMRPTQILAKICKEEGLDGPHYSTGRVRIDNKVFGATSQVLEESGHFRQSDEPVALKALRGFHTLKRGFSLVPEHVETRSLYNPEKPGVEQGKIEMWVDMFPMDMPSPGAPVDITPRKPTSYELRVVIWNTEDVLLEESNILTGEKCSDIFVKGWLEGMKEDRQQTDVHYRSLTGEGNFNWRFIFPFQYQKAEERIVITRKASFFSWDESEEKVPARLHLQVWDADAFSADDFIGDLTLDLTRMPRGAKSAKTCTLDLMKQDGSVPQISFFKIKHIKGFWPFVVNTDEEVPELAGKVEAELELLTQEEAEKKPAGRAREDPQALEKPNRPDSTFTWFMNPFKSLKYLLWNNYKMCLIKFLVIGLLVALMGLFFYSMPGYTVKKIFGA